ncbi:hypothetical protein K402DRAFT_365819 [Aulographum hederae CBS 113979]|uniref:Uncharacterized protein n=1 Tax=Aulographum hederae CBS 113979 TaxID=1176131 RepID=A0A6G1GIQ7_9PEZI|nr:hypothetical protein K402DRAFT_365819 [Aulographum hederae CBS 113979]
MWWTSGTLAGRYRLLRACDRVPDTPDVGVPPSPPSDFAGTQPSVAESIFGEPSEEGFSSQSRPSAAGPRFGGVGLPLTEHVRFVYEFDWSSTPLGPLNSWPAKLRHAVELVLANPHPAAVLWGDDLTVVYNQAAKEIVGSTHCRLFAGSLYEVASDTMVLLDSVLKTVRLYGQSAKIDDFEFHLPRRGVPEEFYITLTFSPIFDQESGAVLGIFENCLETTKQVVSERRMRLLLDVGERLAPSLTVAEFWENLLLSCDGQHKDVPFALLHHAHDRYMNASASRTGDPLSLHFLDFQGTLVRQSSDVATSRLLFSLEDHSREFSSTFRSALEQQEPILLLREPDSAADRLFHMLPDSEVIQSCRNIVVCPLAVSREDNTSTFLLIGVNPLRTFDDEYRVFIQLLSRQIGRSLSSVKLFEEEKARIADRAAYNERMLSLELQLRTNEVKEVELRFRRFVESAPVGIFILSATDGSIIFCNDAWYDISGHAKGDQRPMSWERVVHPLDISRVRQHWDRLAAQRGPETFECRLKRQPWPAPDPVSLASPDWRWVLVSAYSDTSIEGHQVTVLGCMTDIDHQKMEEEMKGRRLAEVLEMKRQQENFMDITSHEMRNPLNAIMFCSSELVEILSKKPAIVGSEKTLQDCIEASRTILHCANHQKRILDDVLTFTKIDSELLAVVPQEVSPVGTVGEALKVFDAEIRSGKIQVTVQGADYLASGPVLMDGTRVVQILINLIANALRFAKDSFKKDLQIKIRVSPHTPDPLRIDGMHYIPPGRSKRDPTQRHEWGNGEILFIGYTIVDTGAGISPEDVNALLDQLTHGSPRTHTTFGNFSLALCVSREMAELHGGAFGLSSTSGTGSTFDFYVKGRKPPLSLSQGTTPETFLAGSESNAVESIGQQKPPSRRLSPPDPLTPTQAQVQAQTDTLSALLRSPKPFPRRPKLGSVLVVEDNLLNQKVLVKLLQQHGYITTVANDGVEALEILRGSTWWLGTVDSPTQSNTLKVDIVLSDIEMPRMDGRETIRRIRQWQRDGLLAADIPVIAVTGNARKEQVNEARMLGFDDVVPKPYKPTDITQRVHLYCSPDITPHGTPQNTP